MFPFKLPEKDSEGVSSSCIKDASLGWAGLHAQHWHLYGGGALPGQEHATNPGLQPHQLSLSPQGQCVLLTEFNVGLKGEKRSQKHTPKYATMDPEDTQIHLLQNETANAENG